MSLFAHLKPISPSIGAEIHDVDLKDVDDVAATELKAILSKHKVLFFPNQDLSIEDHVAFGEKFGKLAYDAWNAEGKFSAKSRYDFQLMGYLDSQK